mgnify:CR=1 FL=1
MNVIGQIRAYRPYNIQEEKDKENILRFLETHEDAFERTNQIAHMTASAWVCNPARDRILMAYHRIYDSWSWLGGHCDGEKDCLKVALREVQEEAGIRKLRALSEEIFSLEILTVNGHIRKGEYVPGHLHLNVTYLLEADDSQPLHIKEDENSGVAWFPFAEAVDQSSEKWFREHIYRKLNEKLRERYEIN